MAKSKLDLQKHTLNFFAGDIEKLAALHPDLEPSVVVRTLVREHIDKVERTITTTKVQIEVP